MYHLNSNYQKEFLSDVIYTIFIRYRVLAFVFLLKHFHISGEALI
ncbi:hypothetical protein LM801516_90033 [Listeria monocytogenes]|nr:hypothetical protein LM801516_90033 [Listeria monocytogenes]